MGSLFSNPPLTTCLVLALAGGVCCFTGSGGRAFAQNPNSLSPLNPFSMRTLETVGVALASVAEGQPTGLGMSPFQANYVEMVDLTQQKMKEALGFEPGRQAPCHEGPFDPGPETSEPGLTVLTLFEVTQEERLAARARMGALDYNAQFALLLAQETQGLPKERIARLKRISTLQTLVDEFARNTSRSSSAVEKMDVADLAESLRSYLETHDGVVVPKMVLVRHLALSRLRESPNAWRGILDSSVPSLLSNEARLDLSEAVSSAWRKGASSDEWLDRKAEVMEALGYEVSRTEVRGLGPVLQVRDRVGSRQARFLIGPPGTAPSVTVTRLTGRGPDDRPVEAVSGKTSDGKHMAGVVRFKEPLVNPSRTKQGIFRLTDGSALTVGVGLDPNQNRGSARVKLESTREEVGTVRIESETGPRFDSGSGKFLLQANGVLTGDLHVTGDTGLEFQVKETMETGFVDSPGNQSARGRTFGGGVRTELGHGWRGTARVDFNRVVASSGDETKMFSSSLKVSDEGGSGRNIGITGSSASTRGPDGRTVNRNKSVRLEGGTALGSDGDGEWRAVAFVGAVIKEMDGHQVVGQTGVELRRPVNDSHSGSLVLQIGCDGSADTGHDSLCPPTATMRYTVPLWAGRLSK